MATLSRIGMSIHIPQGLNCFTQELAGKLNEAPSARFKCFFFLPTKGYAFINMYPCNFCTQLQRIYHYSFTKFYTEEKNLCSVKVDLYLDPHWFPPESCIQQLDQDCLLICDVPSTLNTDQKQYT